MIIKEFYKTRTDGVDLYRIYSDANLYIRQLPTNVEYTEAIDVKWASYAYEETDKPIPSEEASIEDTYQALERLGVVDG